MEYVMNLTVGEIAGWLTAIIASLTVIIEFNKKIDFSPITVALNWVGNKTNKGLMDEMNSMKKDIAGVRKELDNVAADYKSMKDEMDRRNAVNARIRILRFGEEIRNGVLHTKEYFDQSLEDIDYYEKYCAEHPEFVNNRTVRTKERIIAAYDKCLEQNDFL